MRIRTTLFGITLATIAFFEAMSLLGFVLPTVGAILFIFILIGTTILLIWRGLEAGVLILVAELFIGSKGYLFSLEIGEVRISIRLALFLLVMAWWLVAAIRERRFAIRHSRLFWPLVGVFAVVAYGITRGIAVGNGLSDVFYDANGYAYAAIALPVFHIIRDRASLERLAEVACAGLVALALKTMIVLFYFSHQPSTEALRTVYRWIRITGVGEMTRLTGEYFRIFFQSHIVQLIGFVTAGTILLQMNRSSLSRRFFRTLWLIVFFSMTVIIISFSRSFWLALGLTLLGMTFVFWREKDWPFRKILRLPIWFIGLGIVNLIIVTAIVNVPLPGRPGIGVSPASLIEERVSSIPQEAAATSRILLVRPLLRKIREHPVLGSGFGTTVSAQTRDPRTSEINEGIYTSYTFEWGYLDSLTEFGLIGTIIVLLFFYTIAGMGWRLVQNPSIPNEISAVGLGLLAGLLTLLLTHMTTPYLNHPIGLGLAILIAVSFSVLTHERQSFSDRP